MGKIDWLKNPDSTPGITKNYVFGCSYGCPYCYGRRTTKRYGMAERMAECEMRFKYGKDWEYKNKLLRKYRKLAGKFYRFEPTFRPSVRAQKLPKKPTMIFFSMSDPAYWEPEWYEKILEKICQHMQHTFIILTKQPEIYRKYTFPDNCWLGVTICTYHDYNNKALDIDQMQNNPNKILISFEPLQNCFSYRFTEMLSEKFDWLIVGFETGNRKEKIKGHFSWLIPFWSVDTKVFMKESCKAVTKKELRQEWPEGYLNG